MSGGLGRRVAGGAPGAAEHSDPSVAQGMSVVTLAAGLRKAGASSDGGARSGLSPLPISAGPPLAASGTGTGSAGLSPDSSVSLPARGWTWHVGAGEFWPGWTPGPSAALDAAEASGVGLATARASSSKPVSVPSSTVPAAAGGCERHTGKDVFAELSGTTAAGVSDLRSIGAPSSTVPAAAGGCARHTGGGALTTTLSAWAPEYGVATAADGWASGLELSAGRSTLRADARAFVSDPGTRTAMDEPAVRAQNRPDSSFRVSREEVSPVTCPADSVRGGQQAQGSFVGWSNFWASLPLRAPDSSSPVQTDDVVVKDRHSTLLSRAYPSKAEVSSSRVAPIGGSLPTEAQRRFVGLKEPPNSISACMG